MNIIVGLSSFAQGQAGVKCSGECNQKWLVCRDGHQLVTSCGKRNVICTVAFLHAGGSSSLTALWHKDRSLQMLTSWWFEAQLVINSRHVDIGQTLARISAKSCSARAAIAS